MGKALWLSLPRYSATTTNRESKFRSIRRQSVKRRAESTKYRTTVKVWLAEPANSFCAVAKALNWRRMKATQCHHKFGRRGVLLLDKRGWVPVSMTGHEWINSNPARARELGLVCQLGQWNDPNGPSKASA